MPRKDFNADIASAATKNIPGVTGIAKGDEDGYVNFCFNPTSGPPIEIRLAVTDVSDYPSENSFHIFTESDEVPEAVTAALQKLTPFPIGTRIPELINTVSTKLRSALATGSSNDPYSIDDNTDVEVNDLSEDEDDEEEEEYNTMDSDDDNFDVGGKQVQLKTYEIDSTTSSNLNRRIKMDLRAIKFRGFKLGILSGMKAESRGSILSISIQVTKLELSEEVLQAWDLEPYQYIVLLIRYAGSYKTFEAVISEPAKFQDVMFRIGVCNRYKPTLNEALSVFTDGTQDVHGSSNKPEPVQGNASSAGFTSMFISSSLNEFINTQFISLLKIRKDTGLSWDSAKLFFNDRQGLMDRKDSELPQYQEESQTQVDTLPNLVSADHLIDNEGSQISFPLLATQFALRYFLRCTEFCLVCHDRIEEEFGALKPYVCNKPLCLYQYMSLGFGPSVEHEILTQPYVVDLLVSFCYASAYGRRIRDYPTGMALHVPPLALPSISQMQVINGYSNLVIPTTPVDKKVNTPEIESLEATFDGIDELTFQNVVKFQCPFHTGTWVVVSTTNSSAHYRVNNISKYPTVKLSGIPVVRQRYTNHTKDMAVENTNSSTHVEVKVKIYDQILDNMNDNSKAETIVMLIETLPPIKEIQAYLVQQSRIREPRLSTWKERISPAALGILRWIIASNRSCIVQVDKYPGQEEADLVRAKIKLDQKISHVPDNWIQFRFSQGAPDKEQRFLNALKREQANLNSSHPTLFAWHGSPLQNWHSIIRHGLDFKDTLHGRAYGHGVYHALDQSISAGYAMHNGPGWSNSGLKVTQAMSLNEILNCPSKFTSSSPYIVVPHIDWIQCRYLFVHTGDNVGGFYNHSDNATQPASSTHMASAVIQQDPLFTAKSITQHDIGIPQCAVSVSRSFRVTDAEELRAKKKHKSSSSDSRPSTLSDIIASDEEDVEDLVFLFSDDETPTVQAKGKGDSQSDFVILSTPQKPTIPLTDFVPGFLDQSELPLLEPPSYATRSATLRLNQELRTILKIQESTPLHELGWYIDGDNIKNIYQWHFELHSFETSLPLAQDMKTAGVTSIVVEMRFGKDYPHSPPFVRVIRPRFLPFMAGGGGHVTAGGAMCMELLTNTGWSAVSSIESVLLQVRMAIMSLEPKPARLEIQGPHQRDYGTGEAMAAFIRACQTHGWKVPDDFNDFAGGSGKN